MIPAAGQYSHLFVSAELLRSPIRVNSKSEIVRAGKILRENLTEEAIPEIEASRGLTILEAFKIAHAWRDAHMRPLMRVRQELGGKLGSIERGAISAARLKRMTSIRKKLLRPITLYQMQDIAGCRAVLRSMKEVNQIIKIYHDGGSCHEIQSEDPYIQRPKSDGYRSHHLILKYCGTGADEAYNRQTVEIQLRSRPQHAWATAVEAVGLIRHENIKGGEGDEDWRRFFELMSSEISYEEDCPLCPSALGTREDIRAEIRDISKKIKAISTLETYNSAINYAEGYGKTYARYFLLQFDYESREVFVEPFEDYNIGAQRYVDEEKTNSRKNSVLVEVSKVSDLKKAFPNYFLDVVEFTDRLKRVLMPGYGSSQAYDLSWLRGYR